MVSLSLWATWPQKEQKIIPKRLNPAAFASPRLVLLLDPCPVRKAQGQELVVQNETGFVQMPCSIRMQLSSEVPSNPSQVHVC